MNTEKPPLPLTAATLASRGKQSRAQLDVWQHTIERHEQIALALETSGSRVKREKWLEEVENKIEGTGTKSLAGIVRIRE